MNKKRIEIGMVAKRSLPIFVFTTFLFVLADSAFATGADEKSTITDNKVQKSRNGSYSCSNATTEKNQWSSDR